MANEARITDESIITTLSPDDYILIDNATLGTRKIKVIDSVTQINYRWYYNTEKTFVVRVKISDSSYRIYINDFLFNYGSDQNPIPSELEPYAKPLQERGARGYFRSNASGSQYDYSAYDGYVYFAKTYFDNPTTFGMSNGTRYVSGHAKCIFESTDPKGVNEHAWEEPTFDPING